MNRIIVLTIFVLIVLSATSQDLNYAKDIIKELSSEKYYGRGYVNNGDSITAYFLEKEFEKFNLKKFNNSYFQEYNISINSIEEPPILKFNGKELILAKDYVVIPSSPEIEGTFEIEWVDRKLLTNSRALKRFLSLDHSDKFICIDSTGMNNKELYEFANIIFSRNYIGARGIIETIGQLKYTAHTGLKDFVYLQVDPGKIDTGSDSVYVKIKNNFTENYNTRNILGYLPGESDTIIVIGAHYDHLGMLGNTVFPGANDNASGVAMVLNLLDHYNNQNINKYTYVFTLFSGEEAGLLGSKYMTDNPPFNLSKVKAMINFDMIGTGEDGIYIFNADEYPGYNSIIKSLNKDKNYFDDIQTTGAVYSSDHASFHEKGVKSIFIFTKGDNNKYYHQPEDTYETITFSAYSKIFELVVDFINEI